MEKAVISKYEALDMEEEEKMEEEKKMEVEEEEMEIEEEMDEDEEENRNLLLSINWAEEAWPPVWKRSIRECPQYKMGMIRRFVDRWDLEDEPDERPDSEFDLPSVRPGFQPDESDPHGKCYELVKVEKLVYSSRSGPGTYLVTFAVKEPAPAPAPPNNIIVMKTIQAMVYCYGGPVFFLLEWRFKPD